MLSLVLISVAVAVVLVILTKAGTPLFAYRRRELFRSRPLMTDNEIEFFARLEKALPDCKVFSQVAMSGVLDVTLPKTHQAYWRVRSAFDRKRMDYVVCTREGAHLIAVVELDDRTHDPQKDANRDAMLASAGIRTVRFPSHPRPSAMEIRAEVLGRRAA